MTTEANTSGTELTDVCALAELTPGAIRVVELKGRPNVGLLLTNGKVRAFGLMCPHKGAPLEWGTVRSGLSATAPGEVVLQADRCVLTCPWHNWEFSLEDGHALFDAKRRMRMYPAVVEGGRVRLQIPLASKER